MIRNLKKFGYNVHGAAIGEAWISLVEAILKHGEKCYDEKRERLALINVRVKSDTQLFEDAIIERFAEKEKCQAMIDFTFSKDLIEDVDVVKSFQNSAKSYCQRIKDGRLLEFAVKRLSLFPESKKAVITFPTNEDYAKIFDDHYVNDYLPCIVAIQFRLAKSDNGFVLNTTFYARSIDAFQKSHGNMLSIAKLSGIVAEGLCKSLSQPVSLGFLDGFIADAHIYNESYRIARKAVRDYLKTKSI